MLKNELTAEQVRKLSIYDLAYWIAAAITMSAGFTLVYLVGKASGFYMINPVYWAKVLLFAIAILISVIPTRFLLRQKRSVENVIVPKRIVVAIRWELTLLAVMPLLAAMMSRGMGTGWL